MVCEECGDKGRRRGSKGGKEAVCISLVVDDWEREGAAVHAGRRLTSMYRRFGFFFFRSFRVCGLLLSMEALTLSSLRAWSARVCACQRSPTWRQLFTQGWRFMVLRVAGWSDGDGDGDGDRDGDRDGDHEPSIKSALPLFPVNRRVAHGGFVVEPSPWFCLLRGFRLCAEGQRNTKPTESHGFARPTSWPLPTLRHDVSTFVDYYTRGTLLATGGGSDDVTRSQRWSRRGGTRALQYFEGPVVLRVGPSRARPPAFPLKALWEHDPSGPGKYCTVLHCTA